MLKRGLCLTEPRLLYTIRVFRLDPLITGQMWMITHHKKELHWLVQRQVGAQEGLLPKGVLPVAPPVGQVGRLGGVQLWLAELG